MLQPTERPPASTQPRLMASITPGPPPVITATPRLARAAPTATACRYRGSEGPIRAEPKQVTAGPISASTSKPSTNSETKRSTRHESYWWSEGRVNCGWRMALSAGGLVLGITEAPALRRSRMGVRVYDGGFAAVRSDLTVTLGRCAHRLHRRWSRGSLFLHPGQACQPCPQDHRLRAEPTGRHLRLRGGLLGRHHGLSRPAGPGHLPGPVEACRTLGLVYGDPSRPGQQHPGRRLFSDRAQATAPRSSATGSRPGCGTAVSARGDRPECPPGGRPVDRQRRCQQRGPQRLGPASAAPYRGRTHPLHLAWYGSPVR